MSTPEPGQPPDTANGRPYGQQGRIRYTRPIDRAAPGGDTRFYSDDTLFYEEDTLMSGPEPEWSGPVFEPGGPEFGPLPDAAGEAAGGPEPAQPTDPAGGWPYDPEPVRFVDPVDEPVTGDGIRPYGEWSHEAAVPAEPDDYKLPRNLEPQAGWTGGGFHTLGDVTGPLWDDPYPTAPRTPESPRRGRRPAVRPLTVAALALAVVASGAGGALLRGKTASTPAAAPSAAASAGLSATAGGASGTASPQQPAAEPPAISKADAENVVAGYSQVNNKANAAHSDSLLATIEGGSSYTMDTGAYRFELGQSSRAAYVPFQLTDTTYYIPRIPRLSQGSYPRWFAVKSTYVTMADGKNLGTAYVVFAQNASGAPWKDVTEPDILPGQSLPQIAVDSSGYAQSVATDATGLNVAPDKIGQVTAEWLDKLAASKSDSVIKDESGNLTDLQDEVFWRSGQGGTPMDATDVHAAPASQVFALKTTSGGALVFYTTAAQLTLTPANGDTISGGLNIPGYYSPANSAGLTSATVGYVEQFATYIPPAGSNARDVVADISSIASRG
jgi:hypothetical protein